MKRRSHLSLQKIRAKKTPTRAMRCAFNMNKMRAASVLSHQSEEIPSGVNLPRRINADFKAPTSKKVGGMQKAGKARQHKHKGRLESKEPGHPVLEAQDVLQRVVLEGWSLLVPPLSLQQVLNVLLVGRLCEWPTADQSQHLGAAIVRRHGHHGRHEPELCIVRYSKEVSLLPFPPLRGFWNVCRLRSAE